MTLNDDLHSKLEMFFREKLVSPHLPIPIPTFLP